MSMTDLILSHVYVYIHVLQIKLKRNIFVNFRNPPRSSEKKLMSSIFTITSGETHPNTRPWVNE